MRPSSSEPLSSSCDYCIIYFHSQKELEIEPILLFGPMRRRKKDEKSAFDDVPGQEIKCTQCLAFRYLISCFGEWRVRDSDQNRIYRSTTLSWQIIKIILKNQAFIESFPKIKVHPRSLLKGLEIIICEKPHSSICGFVFIIICINLSQSSMPRELSNSSPVLWVIISPQVNGMDVVIQIGSLSVLQPTNSWALT